MDKEEEALLELMSTWATLRRSRTVTTLTREEDSASSLELTRGGRGTTGVISAESNRGCCFVIGETGICGSTGFPSSSASMIGSECFRSGDWATARVTEEVTLVVSFSAVTEEAVASKLVRGLFFSLFVPPPLLPQRDGGLPLLVAGLWMGIWDKIGAPPFGGVHGRPTIAVPMQEEEEVLPLRKVLNMPPRCLVGEEGMSSPPTTSISEVTDSVLVCNGEAGGVATTGSVLLETVLPLATGWYLCVVPRSIKDCEIGAFVKTVLLWRSPLRDCERDTGEVGPVSATALSFGDVPV